MSKSKPKKSSTVEKTEEKKLSESPDASKAPAERENKSEIKLPSFPLYEILRKNLSNKDLTILQKKDLFEKLGQFNEESEPYELIYVLIKYYYIENDLTTEYNIPYSAKVTKDVAVGKDTVSLNFSELPNKLKQLIYKFILLHTKKIEEDATMSIPEE